MLSLVFGDDGPFSLGGGVSEGGFESSKRFHTDGRAVRESNHGGVASAVENFAEANAQRTELAERGVGIDIGIQHQRRAIGIDDGSQGVSIRAGDDEHDIDVREEEAYGGGEERVSGRRSGGARRPGQLGYVVRRENDSAKSWGASHEGTIAKCWQFA